MFLQGWIIVKEAPPPPPTNNVAHPTVAGFAILIATVMFGICVHLVDQLLSRQLSKASSEWRERLYKRWHSVFHWYPQACIPTLAGVGLGMVQVQQYVLACAFLLFSGIWGVGCWLTSDRLRKKRRYLSSLRGRKRSGNSIEDSRKYYAKEFVISAVIAVLTVSAIGLVMVYKLQVQFDDVAAHLGGQATVTPNDSAYRSVFSLRNGSASDVLRETQHTHLKTMMVGHLEKIQLPHSSFDMTNGPALLEKNGGTETNLFVPPLSGQPLACADLTIEISYSLPSWTFWRWKTTKSVPFRFVTRWSPDGLHWEKQPPDSQTDFCFDKQFHAPYGNTF